MKKQPTQELLKKAYDAGAFIRDTRRIYQVEYSQAQRQYWYFPIMLCGSQKIKGYEIIKELGE